MCGFNIPKNFGGIGIYTQIKLPPLALVMVVNSVRVIIGGAESHKAGSPIQVNVYSGKVRDYATCRLEHGGGEVAYGYGKAGGDAGTGRISAAIACAIRSTGIKLGDRDFSGQGLDVALKVLEQLAHDLGHWGIKGFIYGR